jgi:hypothetical protein
MKTIINGEMDGQPIVRQQTSAELLAELLFKQSTQPKGRPDCSICEGSGTMYVPDGEDDVVGETCDCISGINEKLTKVLNENK